MSLQPTAVLMFPVAMTQQTSVVVRTDFSAAGVWCARDASNLVNSTVVLLSAFKYYYGGNADVIVTDTESIPKELWVLFWP